MCSVYNNRYGCKANNGHRYRLLVEPASVSGGDAYLFLAIVSAAAGYAYGVKLPREIPAWQVISWALAPALPIGLLVLITMHPSMAELRTALFTVSNSPDSLMFGIRLPFNVSLVLSLLYLGLISQYAGFLLWYRALALDGIARAS